MGKCSSKTVLQTNAEMKSAARANKRKQIGLLGGTFNPVHIAHLIIADQVYHQLGLDRVDFLPSCLPPHKSGKKTITGKIRLEMLQLVVQGNPTLAIETLELERGGKSFTYDTIKLLKQQHPDTDYYFIIGGDMVEDLPNWYKIDELLPMVQFVGVCRPGYKKESVYPIIWVDAPLMDISSTWIRRRFAEKCSVNYLLPEKIIEYIQQEGLYLHEI